MRWIGAKGNTVPSTLGIIFHCWAQKHSSGDVTVLCLNVQLCVVAFTSLFQLPFLIYTLTETPLPPPSPPTIPYSYSIFTDNLWYPSFTAHIRGISVLHFQYNFCILLHNSTSRSLSFPDRFPNQLFFFLTYHHVCFYNNQPIFQVGRPLLEVNIQYECRVLMLPHSL